MTHTSKSENPLLSGVFEPLRTEFDIPNLRIEGTLPPGLEGVLYRIGPNPQFPPLEPYNPLQGDGMIHAFRIGDGRVSYRNRWVRTRRWTAEHAAGRALFATMDLRGHDPSVAELATDGAANTNIISHAGRLLALEEGHKPIEIDPHTLATIGPYDFGGRLKHNMTAHPRIDPATGEMIFFSNFPNQSFDGGIVLHVVNASGALVRSARIASPFPALVHDFAITAQLIIFVVSPLTLSLQRLTAGRPPIAWEPERGVHVGIVRRDDLAVLRWARAPAAMVWHILNAFEDGDRLVLDLCQQDAAAFPTPDGSPPDEKSLRQFLTRWTIEPSGAVAIEQLSDLVCEYPRMDERRTGLKNRFGYFAADGGPGTDDLCHRAIAVWDASTSRMSCWRAGSLGAVSEPVFVPKRDSREEGDGYLLATLFDASKNASALLVFDALDIGKGPMACAPLGHRVPAGFHGSFVSDGSRPPRHCVAW